MPAGQFEPGLFPCLEFRRGGEWQSHLTSMNQKELKELIEFLIEKDIAEFELERGDVKVRIRRGSEPVVSAATPDTRFFAVQAAVPSSPELGAAPAPPSPAATTPRAATQSPAPEEGLHIV